MMAGGVFTPRGGSGSAGERLRAVRLWDGLRFRAASCWSPTDEPRDVLPLFLAQGPVLVPVAPADRNAHAIHFPDASQGIQGGEGGHRAIDSAQSAQQ